MKILFLCVANSARSQMAEGLARRQLAGRAEVQSAGSAPGGEVHPLAVEVMREIGIDITNHRPRGIDDLDKPFLASLDYVITLCAEETCPLMLTGAEKLHWPTLDPALAAGSGQARLQAFRTARDAIAGQLKAWKPKVAS
jgi:arsenate reductase